MKNSSVACWIDNISMARLRDKIIKNGSYPARRGSIDPAEILPEGLNNVAMMIPDLNDPDEIERIIREIDPTVRLWDFTAPEIYHRKREFDFASDDFVISVVDPFKGFIPLVISRETLAGGRPPLIPTIILDSNVMANLHQFVAYPNQLEDKKKKVVANLLDYLLHQKDDYNPVFYYLESFSRAAIDSPMIVNYTKSLLSLHMMDELHFLKRREIRPNPETLEKYIHKFGTSNLDEMAFLQCQYLRDRFTGNTNWKVMYLILLKAALIQKTRKTRFQSKMRELYEFIYEVFGVLFAVELSIAAFYFSGKLDKFIPLQRGANYEMVINRLQSTAWDLYLLKLPEIFLCQENPPLPLAAICTGDKSVQYIGRKFRIRKLYTSQGKPFPELQVDYSDLTDPSTETEDIFLKLVDEFEKNREAKRRLLDTEKVLNSIDDVIHGIENEVRDFCHGGQSCKVG